MGSAFLGDGIKGEILSGLGRLSRASERLQDGSRQAAIASARSRIMRNLGKEI